MKLIECVPNISEGQNKEIIDMGIRKGFLTKEQAINDLGMKNEYR